MSFKVKTGGHFLIWQIFVVVNPTAYNINPNLSKPAFDCFQVGLVQGWNRIHQKFIQIIITKISHSRTCSRSDLFNVFCLTRSIKHNNT